jgi:hypothetical protein
VFGGDNVIIPEVVGGGIWDRKRSLEFYVDFETITSAFDNFKKMPWQGGTNMIFMIGVGWVNRRGNWKYKCFVAERLKPKCEKKIMEDFLALLEKKSKSYNCANPISYHWGNAEMSFWNSACNRHPEKTWEVPNFMDFLKVFKEEPILVKGVLDFGLKNVAKGMIKHGLIGLAMPEAGEVADGLGAMMCAYTSYKQASKIGVKVEKLFKFKPIIVYNEIDCKMVWKIIEYIRENLLE